MKGRLLRLGFRRRAALPAGGIAFLRALLMTLRKSPQFQFIAKLEIKPRLPMRL